MIDRVWNVFGLARDKRRREKGRERKRGRKKDAWYQNSTRGSGHLESRDGAYGHHISGMAREQPPHHRRIARDESRLDWDRLQQQHGRGGIPVWHAVDVSM